MKVLYFFASIIISSLFCPEGDPNSIHTPNTTDSAALYKPLITDEPSFVDYDHNQHCCTTRCCDIKCTCSHSPKSTCVECVSCCGKGYVVCCCPWAEQKQLSTCCACITCTTSPCSCPVLCPIALICHLKECIRFSCCSEE